MAYSALMLLGYWSVLSDMGTTMRIVGSDRACAETPIHCNWLSFAADKTVSVAIVSTALISLFAIKCEHRHRVQMGAAIAAVAHFGTNWMLYTPLPY